MKSEDEEVFRGVHGEVMMWERQVQVKSMGKGSYLLLPAVPASNPHHVAHGRVLAALVQQNASPA